MKNWVNKKNLLLLTLLVFPNISFAKVIWADSFDGYALNSSSWYSGTSWERPTPVPGNSNIVTTTLGSNSTPKFTGVPWYTAWNFRTFGTTISPTADVQVTARVAQALNGAAPSAVGWPLSNHIILSNMAIGIDAGHISYGIVDYNDTRKLVSRNYTQVALIEGEIWYDVKLIIHQIPGVNNDTADLYYKKATDILWTLIATNVNTNHDLDGKVWLHTYNISTGLYMGYIDDIVLILVESEVVAPNVNDVTPKWTDDFEDYYPLNWAWWYPGSGWDELVSDVTIVNQAVGGNTGQKASPVSWYRSWHQRRIGDYRKGDPNVSIILTGQVSSSGINGQLSPTWPIACHISACNVAVGISGNRISWGVVAPGYQENLYSSPTWIPKTGIGISKDVWYDLMLVVKQVAGANNDVVEVWYKPADTSEWNLVENNIQPGCDVGDYVYMHGCSGDGTNTAGTYLDNFKVFVPPFYCGDDGAAPIAGDTNHDCRIDYQDLWQVAFDWLKCSDPINGDCILTPY